MHAKLIMKFSRIVQLLLVATPMLLRLPGSASASGYDCPDQYVYTKQPPADLIVCNPYVNGQLKMSCSVLGQNITSIQWWFASGSDEDDAVVLTNSTKYFLRQLQVVGGLEVQLSVQNLDNDDSGMYWCQASVVDVHGVQLLSTSETIMLQDKEWFEGIENGCNFELKNSDTRCASILVTETVSVVPTTFPEPHVSRSSVSPTSYLSPTNFPWSIGTHPPNEPTVHRPPNRDIFEGSRAILYSVLGLVGCLVVVCLLLIVIVIVLCRRRCAQADIKNNAAEKEMGFEQFSNQSDFPPLYKHDVSSRIIHSDTHSRNLSGEYAEIGPALSTSLERGYSLIGVSHSDLPPLPTVLNPAIDQLSIPGYENPYDLPMFHLAQDQRQMDVTSRKSPVAEEGTDSRSLGSHEYHVLEQIAPLSSETSPPLLSPHHTYHTLENPNSPSRSCDHLSSSVPVVSIKLDVNNGDTEITTSPRLSCSSATNVLGGRLSTIPESDTEDQRTLDLVNPSHTSDAISPEMTSANPEDSSGFSESSSKDDREYDRLIDPPHLYHILEHSPLPGCPRVHSFPPTTYDNLEAVHTSKRKAHLLPHIHILNPQVGVTNLTYSSGSSLDALETNVFDDPRYLVSPPGRARLGKSACGAHTGKELRRSHSYSHGNAQSYVYQVEARDDTAVCKYSGDYERDPVYMQQLCNGNGNSIQANSSMSRQPLKVVDDSYFWHDDSGFSTYSGSQLSLQDRDKGSSLPNLTKHIYQPLETETMDPPQPYDKLKKLRKETSV